MKKKILMHIRTLAIVAGIIAMPLAATPASAIDVFQGNCGTICTSGGQSGGDDIGKLVTKIVNVLLIVLGVIAVIMIIIGGIRYTTSNGDSSQIKSAKDTVLYAVVGLVIAIMAYAIVNFVVSAFK
jgi:hypothetical protein